MFPNNWDDSTPIEYASVTDDVLCREISGPKDQLEKAKDMEFSGMQWKMEKCPDMNHSSGLYGNGGFLNINV